MLAAFKPRAVVAPALPALPPAPTRDMAGMVNALDRVMAVIEFNPDGTIITANANFSSAMGYALNEIQGPSTAALTKTAEQMTGIVDADRRHRFADQPACAQRHHRVGTGG